MNKEKLKAKLQIYYQQFPQEYQTAKSAAFLVEGNFVSHLKCGKVPFKEATSGACPEYRQYFQKLQKRFPEEGPNSGIEEQLSEKNLLSLKQILKFEDFEKPKMQIRQKDFAESSKRTTKFLKKLESEKNQRRLIQQSLMEERSRRLQAQKEIKQLEEEQAKLDKKEEKLKVFNEKMEAREKERTQNQIMYIQNMKELKKKVPLHDKLLERYINQVELPIERERKQAIQDYVSQKVQPLDLKGIFYHEKKYLKKRLHTLQEINLRQQERINQQVVNERQYFQKFYSPASKHSSKVLARVQSLDNMQRSLDLAKKQQLRERQRNMQVFISQVQSRYAPRRSQKKHLELLQQISKLHAGPKPLKRKSMPHFVRSPKRLMSGVLSQQTPKFHHGSQNGSRREQLMQEEESDFERDQNSIESITGEKQEQQRGSQHFPKKKRNKISQSTENLQSVKTREISKFAPIASSVAPKIKNSLAGLSSPKNEASDYLEKRRYQRLANSKCSQSRMPDALYNWATLDIRHLSRVDQLHVADQRVRALEEKARYKQIRSAWNENKTLNYNFMTSEEEADNYLIAAARTKMHMLELVDFD